ncbi:MAG: response regulator [Kofleriaceae bacterium]|nr:response regulator [Kofleriaceae bacterium]MBP6839171.1 response regulator [Kofleriaceae bacterium]MBP9207672.1 response regulator [Kofleriaceae bacterium]
MRSAPVPANEAARLAVLADLRILDTEPEQDFDFLAGLAARLLAVPIALISLIDRDRQWFKARVGVAGTEVPRELAICSHVVSGDAALVVEDARTDERFRDNPLVIGASGAPGVVFYAGVPLRTSGGLAVGTMCVIDHQPRQFGADELTLLTDLASQAGALLELRRIGRELREERAAALSREAELAEQELRSRAIFDGMVEGVVLQDRTGRIHAHNPAAERILGLTTDQLLGRSSVDPRWRAVRADGSPFPGDEHPAMVTLRTGRPLTDVLMGVHKPGGELTWISINTRPLLDGGGVEATAVVATFRDITEQRQLAERLGAQERVAAIGTLAAGVGHEINNPLSFVLSNLDVALEELQRWPAALRHDRVAEFEHLLIEARGGAERIQRITRGLRALVREGAPNAPTPVGPAIDSALEVARHELRLKATVDVQLVEVPPVSADGAGLTQALTNLLVNAAQAFRVSDPSVNRVTVRCRREEGNKVAIEISDNGPGIAPEVLPRIFDPFFTTRGVGQGTGLGLPTAYSLIHGFGGELRCRTRLGDGTQFTVLLPTAEPQPDPGGDTPVTAGATSRVLVIDDEPIILRSMTRILSGEHQVTALSDPREALALIAGGARFDVIICDLLMPHQSGMEVYEAVLACAPDQAARFVFITGDTSRDDVRAFLTRVPNERLDKPFSVQNLRGIARRYAAERAGPPR